MIDAIARSLGRLALGVKLGVRSFTDIDTNPVPTGWTHVTKIDPEDEKKLPILYPLYLAHTSAISVGGSRDVTSHNTEETFDLLDLVEKPVFHEPSAARHVTEKTREESEFLAIPEVLNGDSDALIGTLGEGSVYLKDEMVPELIRSKLSWVPVSFRTPLAEFLTGWLLETAVFEAYIIQNVDSAAAREANVTEADRLSPQAAAEHALAAETHLGSQVIYLEYSGTFGGAEAEAILESVSETIGWARIWYGGGISSRPQAEQILDAGADSVVVGNVFHEIATDERSLVEEAREDLDSDATLKEIETWVEDRVDITETNGYAYLSTIPDVSAPKRLSRDLLARSVSLHLLIGEIGDVDGDETARADTREGPTALESSLRELWASEDRHGVPPAYLEFLGRTVSGGTATPSADVRETASHVEGLSPE